MLNLDWPSRRSFPLKNLANNTKVKIVLLIRHTTRTISLHLVCSTRISSSICFIFSFNSAISFSRGSGFSILCTIEAVGPSTRQGVSLAVTTSGQTLKGLFGSCSEYAVPVSRQVSTAHFFNALKP